MHSLGARLASVRNRYTMEISLAALCVLLGVMQPKFFTLANLLNVLRNVSLQGIIAFGMTMIIISGEIDLSVGSTVALSGCLTAYVAQKMINNSGNPVFAICAGVVCAILCCAIFGLLTAFLRNKYKVPSFITTLALMSIEIGIAFLITNGFPITPFPSWYEFFGMGEVFGVPFPAIILIFVFLSLHFLMSSTSFGRSIYAVGGNAEAARLSGINIGFVKTVAFAITALMSALSGVMLSSQIMSGSPSVAKGWELNTISAVIIGGASLAGGSGKISKTLFGIIFLGIVINGMTLLGVSTYWQYVVRGTLILAAVFIYSFQAMRKVKAFSPSQ